jgi:hypothetical protein
VDLGEGPVAEPLRIERGEARDDRDGRRAFPGRSLLAEDDTESAGLAFAHDVQADPAGPNRPQDVCLPESDA